MLIEVNRIHTFYGKSHILQNVSLNIEKGEIVALLGRNGVGKSTTLKSVVGLVSPAEGSIRFKGKEVLGLKPYKIVKMGIGYIPEERRIFPDLTVRQNLLIGMKSNGQVEDSWSIEKIYHYFPRLKERDAQRGGNLSGGEQQMLTIGRTLLGNPELLLVDEPTEGLAPQIVDMVLAILQEIQRKGVSIILVEQALDVALELAKRIYVMSKGTIVFEGNPEELGEVRRKYLEV